LKTWDQQLHKQGLLEMGNNGDLSMHRIAANSLMFMNISPVASQIFRSKIGMIAYNKNHQVVLMKTEKSTGGTDLLWDNLQDLPLLSSQFKYLNAVLHLNPSLLGLWILFATFLKPHSMKITVFRGTNVKLLNIKKRNKSIKNNMKSANFLKIFVNELLQLIGLRSNLINSINAISQH